MSGHNKWSGIKHRKEAQDIKRSKVFTRIAKIIAVAVQNGGSDVITNNALRIAIDQARKANMPKDNIDRAIKRGSGADSTRIEEVVYEAMGPGGVAMMIACATDNTNRTLTEIKTILKKNNGKFVPSGSVAFQFDYVGYIVTASQDVDTAEMTAIDAGADDVFVEDDSVIIITKPQELHAVLSHITDNVTEAKLVYNPTQTIQLDENDRGAYEKLYDLIDNLDDVVEIFDNVA
jgi:YebC/PmpR family DNA-binding regulatory protein